MGHSIGRWDGDTLVVDTTGIDERSWLDTAGHEHSAQLRLTERFKKIHADSIEWTVTFDDPVFFTRPWSITRTFRRGKPGDRVLPYTCTENNRDVEHLRPYQPNLDYKHTPEPAEGKPLPKKPASPSDPKRGRIFTLRNDAGPPVLDSLKIRPLVRDRSLALQSPHQP